MGQKILSEVKSEELIDILKERFVKNLQRHEDIGWEDVLVRLIADSRKLWSINQMEATGGEPDVVNFDAKTGEYIFCDCSPESPAGRRNLCYDREAQLSRDKNIPSGNAMDVAAAMGVSVLTEEEYRYLQTLGRFDAKTSSWLQTPQGIRKLGGAIFGDFRFGNVFIYHNGASSYYAVRGFRGSLRV